jgi:hypothetical protein
MYVLIGIPVLLIVFLTVLARLEKRMVWPYGNFQNQPQFTDDSGYGARWVEGALKEGFQFIGWTPDIKGPIYKVNYAFLVSPKHDHLVIIGVGSILKMKLRGTWIYTLMDNDKLLYSTDNQSCVHVDVSHKWRTHLMLTNTFAGLLRSHEDLVQRLGVVPRSFNAGREVEDFKRLREEHYQLMAKSGFIAFMDSSATHWHYTYYGALKWAILNYVIGLMRGITKGKIPECA